MLTSLWADSPGLRCIAGLRKGVTQHWWFESTDAAMSRARELDGEGWDVYFSPALYDPALVKSKQDEVNPRTKRNYTGREQSTTHLMPALWLDLDCGEGKDYPDQGTAVQALQTWLAATKIPDPSFVVSSGYGLHIYWQLTTPVPHDKWLAVAKHLKQSCRVHGLMADPARTSDAASIMRMPGTRNHKYRTTAPVEVLASRDDTVDLQAFRARLPMVGPLGAVPVATPKGEWDTTAKLPPGDANKIASKCSQMGLMRFHKGKMPEPEWRAGLSILWRCEDAEVLIQDWSRGDPRYDPKLTRDKAEGTLGPATCAHFSDLNPEGCAGCPYAGKIASPINLAYAEELPEPGSDATDEGPIAVPGYAITKEGLFKEPTGLEGGPLMKISDFAVWIEDAREFSSADDHRLRAALTLAWRDVRGKPYTAGIPHAELHDPRSWTTWLANNNLASFVKGAEMSQYISKMHKIRYAEKGARTVYDRLGWYENHSLFVTGKQGIRVDSIEDVIVDAQGSIAELAPSGTLEKWREGMRVLGQKRYQAHAFALLMGFAAPLLDLVGKQGAVVALVGESGKGKTLAAECGLSVFAHPKSIQGSGRDTINALGMYLGQLRHVPALVDEVTTLKDYRMRDLIYMAANGTDKAALNQKRERKAVMTWRTVTMLTSNHSIVDRHQKDIEEAHRRRLVEVPVLNGVTADVGALLGQLVLKHHGVAAVPYMQLVMQHKDKIPALFELVEKQITAWGSSNPADRFGTWTCTAALLGGILAYVAGVLPFDPTPVVKTVCKAAAKASETIRAPDELAHEVLFELLTTHSKRVCVWAEGKLALDDTNDPVARINGGSLLVRAVELQNAWDAQHIYRRALTPWLANVAPEGKKYHRLAPGTPPVRAYRFSLKALDWDMKTLKGDM